MNNFKLVFIKVILISVGCTNAKKVQVFLEMPRKPESNNVHDLINKLIKPLQDSQVLNSGVELEIVVQNEHFQKKFYPKSRLNSQNLPQDRTQQLFIVNPRQPFAMSDPDPNQEGNMPNEIYDEELPEIQYPRARIVNINRLPGRLDASDTQSMPDSDQRPVSMKDLKEVIENFEKRINATIMSYKDSNQQPKNTGIKKTISNMADLVDLIKRGVEVSFEAKKPSDERFNWVQVKIPNKS